MKQLKTIALAAMAIAVTTVGHAQTGTIGLGDITTPSVTPGTDINGATTFTIGDLASFSDTTGVFAGMQSQTFGPVTFNPSLNHSFSFNSPVFGAFTSTSITLETSTEGFVSIDILGDYTSGSIDPGIVNDPASVDYSFTQNPSVVGGISDSGELSIGQLPIPPTSVPEPGSLVLAAVGVGALSMHLRRRKAC
jgi:hypothetical protein